MSLEIQLDKPQPEKEISDSSYTWRIYNAETTGITILSLKDEATGINISTPLVIRDKPTASLLAWAGARQSRSPNTAVDIFAALETKNTDVAKKLEETFAQYGHASVADMARLYFHADNVPMSLPFTIFNSGVVNGGQEKSTRYQKGFGQSRLPDLRLSLPQNISDEVFKALNTKYLEAQEISLQLFNKWREKFNNAFTEYFKPDPNNKSEMGALESRALDASRKFLLLGFPTGLAYDDSARNIAKLIADLRGSPVNIYRRFGDQLGTIFAPLETIESELGFRSEASSLIRHAEAYTQVRDNTAKLKAFLISETSFGIDVVPNSIIKDNVTRPDVAIIGDEYTTAEKMVMQYVLVSMPNYNPIDVLKWVRVQHNEVKTKISHIIFEGHDNYRELNGLAETSSTTVYIQASLAVLRDFNRHRAWGRFIPLLQANRGLIELISNGFVPPAYLSEIPEFYELESEYRADVARLFYPIDSFVGYLYAYGMAETGAQALLSLFPLGVKSPMLMHGDIKQLSYFTNQRSRPGGDLDYTQLAHDINSLAASRDPLLSGLKISPNVKLLEQGVDVSVRPSAADRIIFLNRS